MSRILGMDWGTKRIGLAIGDEEQKVSLPFDMVENKEGFIGRLRKIIEDEGIYRIVIGMPITMSGVEADKAEEVRQFIDLLKQHFNLSIITEDERLSSKSVDALFREYKQKYQRDTIAAMVILQNYLDKIG